jgi:hypothetical protein
MEITIDILFSLLGGRKATAEILGVGQWSLYKYRKAGIPPKHLKTIAKKTNLTMEQVSLIQPEKKT